MSFFLILFLILLLAGAGITAYLVHREHKYSNLIGAAIILAVLILWVIARGQLPLELASSLDSSISIAPIWNFYVDETAWGLTLMTFLLAAGVILAIDVWSRTNDPTNVSYQLNQRALPLIFILVAAAILALWSNTLITLVQSWAIFIIAWSIFYGVIRTNSGSWRTVFFRSCFLSISLIFLWLANASNEGPISKVSDLQTWTSESAYWALLAASVFLGLILLHWWRPLESNLPFSVDSLIHLMPAICGGWLFIQVGSVVGSNATPRLIITLLCLIGLFTGATMAWANIKQPRRLPPYLTLSYVNMIALTTVWVGTEAAAAEMQITLLALGGLFLFSSWSSQSGRWERIVSFIFVIALAGLPLTLGFEGRVELYRNWLDGGQLILALAVAFIFAAVIGAALLIVLYQGTAKTKSSPRGAGHLEYGAVLTTLALGVIGFKGLDLLFENLLPFLFIVLPLLGGYFLSRRSIQAYEVEQTVARAVHINFPGQQIYEYLSEILSNIQSIIREGAAILEGEGGMLWLLIIVIILWLARIS